MIPLRIVPHGQPTVSLCMIVKNEEATLSKCIESVQALVNEIVIVDTGSTDNTVKIAEDHGARVLHKKWSGNFSDARNYAIKHATGQWILHLDADEELEKASIPELIEIINNKDIDGVFCIQCTELDSFYSSQLYNLRLFRNSPSVYYEGMVHETPVVDGKTVFSNIRIAHHACAVSSQTASEKIEKYKTYLINQLKDNPDDIRTHYYLAKTYYDQQCYDKCISEGKEVLRLLSHEAPLTEAVVKTFSLLTSALWRKGEFAEAEKMCQRALMVVPDYADAPFLLGALCFVQGKYDDAILGIKRFFHIKDRLEREPDSPNKYISIHSMTCAHQAHFMLGTIYEKQGNYAAAITQLNNAIKLEPKYIEAYYNLGVVYEKIGDPRGAMALYRKTIELNHSFIPGLKRLGILLIENNHAEEGSAILKRVTMFEKSR